MNYTLWHLKDASRPGSKALQDACAQLTFAGDTKVFGCFAPLFGLASNELYLMTCGTELTEPDLASASVLSKTSLFPTVRPNDHSARTKPGIYVFRWFFIDPADSDEIVELSNAAWPTFEGSFATEVQGLFRCDDAGRMLLLTWYEDLSAWEASRHPPDTARDNFLRRHQLTKEALPIATSLASTIHERSLISHS